MSAKFVNVDRNTPMLLAVDLREWLPSDHIAHFIIESIESLDLHGFRVNERGSGSAQYPPSMMLALLIYGHIRKLNKLFRIFVKLKLKRVKCKDENTIYFETRARMV